MEHKMINRLWNLEKDYDTLVKWWNQHEFGVVPQEVLPPDGIMIEKDGVPICAGGLYIGKGTRFAFMEWIVGNKEANKMDLHTGLKLCIDSIFVMAKDKEMDLVFTTTGEEALQKRYTKYHGMDLTENAVKTYLKDLKGNTYKKMEWILDDEQISKRNSNK
jgi:hypothetical protein